MSAPQTSLLLPHELSWLKGPSNWLIKNGNVVTNEGSRERRSDFSLVGSRGEDLKFCLALSTLSQLRKMGNRNELVKSAMSQALGIWSSLILYTAYATSILTCTFKN